MRQATRLHAILGAVLCLPLMVGCGTTLQGPRPSSTSALHSEASLNLIKDLVMHDARAGFDSYDANHDGVLTRDEVPFLQQSTFEAMDSNHDGKITWDEGQPQDSVLQAALSLTGTVLSDMFHRLDLNDDGQLNASELAQTGAFPNVSAAEVGTGVGFNGFVRLLDEQAQHASNTEALAAPSDKPPVVMVPGWFLPTAIWIPLGHKLQALGYTRQLTVPHWPSFGDIRDYAAATAYRVQRLRAETGAAKVDVLGHSMGGLVLRYYIKNLGGDQVVSHYVSFGTPQHGTVIGHLFPVTSCQQMYPNSDFLTQLNAGTETPGPIKYTTLRTNTDEIVLNETSPELQGADNYEIPFSAHLALVWDPRSQKIALDALAK